jgi:hypothetical protein
VTDEDRSRSAVEWHPDAPILLTREQAAEWCQVSLNILDEWTYEPGFPVLRRSSGHFVRIHRLELEKWLAERATESNPRPLYEEPLPAARRPRRGS